MVIDVVAKGSTIEEARDKATAALNAPENVIVGYEVITMPEKKLFGLFGGKDAEVRAYYEIEDAPKKAEKKPEKKAAPQQKKAQPKKDNAPAEKKAQPKKDNQEKKAAPQQKKQAPKAKAPAEKKPEEVVVPELELREPVELKDAPASVQRAYDYLKVIIEEIGVKDAKIDILKNEKEYFFQVLSEEDYSLIIGRRGETLDSIQYLVRLAANHGHEEGKAVRISINIGDYRQKREHTLHEIARKNARRVRKYGRSVTLNPMNPSERRMIHTTVSEIEGVVSYSVGEDSERRVVIALAEGVEPLSDRPPRRNNNRGGYRGNNRGGNRNGNRGGNRGGNRNTNSQPKQENNRAPRSDSAGVRYGKITPKAKPAETESENKD